MNFEAGLAQGLRGILSVAGLIVAGALGLKVLALVAEPRLTFMPVAGLPITPARFDLPYEDVFIESGPDVRIHGWLIPTESKAPAAGQGSPAILFFHGNAENIAPYAALGRLAREAGHALLLVDYRGYGRSEGSPSERGIYRDGAAALRYLRARDGIDPARIVAWGRSIGSCVAFRLAAAPEDGQAPPAGLVLESTFTSARALLREGGYWPLYALSFLGTYRFDQASLAHRVTAPTLVVHGTNDEVVPFSLGRDLHDRIPGRRAFLAIEGGGHNDLMALHLDALWGGVRSFLESLEGPAERPAAAHDQPG